MTKLKYSFLLIFLVACRPTAKSDLILGTWNFVNSPPNVNAKFIFTKTTLVYKNNMWEDAVLYTFNSAENKLTTTEKIGRVDEITIIKLTGNDLVMVVKDGNDTLRLQKD